MPKVLCTLPNAADEISGVKFVRAATGMLSEEVSEAVAARFCTIPGYALHPSDPPKPPAVNEPSEMALLKKKNVEDVLKAIPSLSVEQLKELSTHEDDGSPRKRVVEAIAAAMKAKEDPAA